MSVPPAAQGEVTDSSLEELLAFIRDARGFDFTGYKRSSLARRIRKRMHEAGVSDFADYRDRLESSAEEFRHLFTTILINVTGFFRDAETWTYLQRRSAWPLGSELVRSSFLPSTGSGGRSLAR